MVKPLNIFIPHCSDLLTDHLPHGDGLVAHGFISHLAERGHRLHVAAQRVDLREPLPSNVRIYEIPLRLNAPLVNRLEYMARVRSLFSNLRKKQRFDLIHQLNPVFTGMSLALVGSGVPLVLGTYVARWPEDAESGKQRDSGITTHARQTIARLQQRNADALVLTTPAAQNRLPEPQAVEDRIYTLPHGMDAELFSPVKDWDSPARMTAEQENPSILFFANVVERKGIFTLLSAFEKVSREIPNCVLRIAGDGPALAEVKRRAALLSCSNQIEFLGRQSREAATELYRECSVYCLPSFGEPYGMTVVEAMSCAKSLVVTEAGALPYLVHERGGKRVPAGNSTALAEALVALLNSPTERMSMGRYNRAVVESTMTWERVVEQLESIYEQTIRKFKTKQGGKRQPIAEERIRQPLVAALNEVQARNRTEGT
jgi:L-malate glycosyltransferase